MMFNQGNLTQHCVIFMDLNKFNESYHNQLRSQSFVSHINHTLSQKQH